MICWLENLYSCSLILKNWIMTKQENTLRQYWIQFKMITATFSKLFDVELVGNFIKGLKEKKSGMWLWTRCYSDANLVTSGLLL